MGAWYIIVFLTSTPRDQIKKKMLKYLYDVYTYTLLITAILIQTYRLPTILSTQCITRPVDYRLSIDSSVPEKNNYLRTAQVMNIIIILFIQYRNNTINVHEIIIRVPKVGFRNN